MACSIGAILWERLLLYVPKIKTCMKAFLPYLIERGYVAENSLPYSIVMPHITESDQARWLFPAAGEKESLLVPPHTAVVPLFRQGMAWLRTMQAIFAVMFHARRGSEQ